jgi:RNA polymerase sigma-70 factor (ECF subfamily)
MKETDSLSDEILAKRLTLGDLPAFNLVFKRHYKMVVNVIYKYIDDATYSEDIAQAVFVKMWDNHNKLDIHTSLSSYLRRAGINGALNYISTQKRFIFSEPDNWETELLDTSAEEKEQRQEKDHLELQLHEAINQLPEKCRIVFTLNRFEGFSHKEIAEKLDITPKTIENHMSKALRLIKEAMLRSSNALILLLFVIKKFI